MDIYKTIFGWHVHEHITKDWPKVRRYVRNGVFQDPDGEEVILGEYENEKYGGHILISNGENLYRMLQEDEVIRDKRKAPPMQMNSIDDFADYSRKYRKKDGAAILDCDNHKIYNIMRLENNPKKMKVDHDLYIPSNFMAFDESYNEIGNKTDIAISFPQYYKSIHTFQIKRTAYTPLGTGKVTHFDRNGLVEEFFLASISGYPGRYLDKENNVVGVYRAYDRRKGVDRNERAEMIINTPQMPEMVYLSN